MTGFQGIANPFSTPCKKLTQKSAPERNISNSKIKNNSAILISIELSNNQTLVNHNI